MTIVNQSDAGTIYIGDGSWGVDVTSCAEKDNMGLQQNIF